MYLAGTYHRTTRGANSEHGDSSGLLAAAAISSSSPAIASTNGESMATDGHMLYAAASAATLAALAASVSSAKPLDRRAVLQQQVVKPGRQRDDMLVFYAEALAALLDTQPPSGDDASVLATSSQELVSAHQLAGRFRRELTKTNSHKHNISLYIATIVPSDAPVAVCSDTPQSVARACYTLIRTHAAEHSAHQRLHSVTLRQFSVEEMRADKSMRSAKSPDHVFGDRRKVDAHNIRLMEMECTFCSD